MFELQHLIYPHPLMHPHPPAAPPPTQSDVVSGRFDRISKDILESTHQPDILQVDDRSLRLRIFSTLSSLKCLICCCWKKR